MRWFKHMTLTRSDERVAAYVSECGMEGYGFFWVVLETVALSMDKTGKCEVYYPLTYWVTQGQLHRTKIFRYLTALKSHGLLMVDFSGGMVLVKVPNLLKYRDEYTKRSGQTPDKLPTKYRDNVGTLSGQTPDQDTDTDTDTEKVIDNKSTTTTVVDRRKFFVGLLEKYFSPEQMVSMLRSSTGQSMLTAWVEAGVPEKAVISVLDDWIATGQSLNSPTYYRAQILNHGKTAIKGSRRRLEETPEEYEARIKIKAREATEMTLRAIAEKEAQECIKTS